MVSFEVDYELNTTFQNYIWTIQSNTAVGTSNSFNDVGIEIYLGVEPTYETYKTWLTTKLCPPGAIVDNVCTGVS